MNVEAAQNEAIKKLRDAQAKVDKAKADAGDCLKEIEDLQQQVESLDQSALNAIKLKQEGSSKMQKEIDELNKQKKEHQDEMIKKMHEQEDYASKIFTWNKDKKLEEMNKDIDSKRNEVLEANKKLNEKKKQQEYLYGLTDEEKELFDKKQKLEKAQADLKSGKCGDAAKALEAAKAELENLGYTEEDVAELEEAAKSLNNKANKYNLGQIRANADANSQQLMDMRNLPGGINFRSNQRAMRVSANGKTSDKDNTVLSPSKSYYMNQDYLFTNSLASPVPLGKINFDSLPEIQTLIINEFQPYEMLSVADLLPGMVNTLIDITQKAVSSAGFVANIAKTSLVNNQIDNASKNPSEIYGNGANRKRSYFTKDPVQQVENMFNGGKWLNTYEVPFYGKDYIKGRFSEKWSIGGAKESMGGVGSFMQNMGIDFPSNPKFKIEMSGAADRKISTEFYLINTNDSWLKRNFQFIHAIFAGTSWMHLNYCLIRPPNVYHVLCPGRFQMLWAGMDVEVTFEGKLRKNAKVSKELREMNIKSIDEDMLWPDAWKIKLDIRDFTPDNFNMYAEYYMNGFNGDEIQSLAHQIKISEMLNDLGNFISNVTSDMVESGRKLASQATESAKTTVNNIYTSIEKMTEKTKEDAKNSAIEEKKKEQENNESE